MAVWEACPLNKSTNKNANSHISREGTQPKSLPHIPFLSVSLSTKLHSLSLFVSHTQTHTKLLIPSLLPLLLLDRRLNEEDRFTYLSFTFFFSPLWLSSLNRFNSHSLSPLHTQTCAYIIWCRSAFSVKTQHIKVYSYVWGSTDLPWLGVPPVCLSADHPHAYQQVHAKDHPYLGELCAKPCDANRCSFKRAENYVSNISGACFKEFMFCIWNGRRSTVYTLNNLSSQPDWGIESLLA